MKIGAYEVVGELGRGGMGVVYRARAADGREVAVKVLPGDDPDARDAFERERRLLSSLGLAEGFVPILDSGIDGTRRWLVMPLVPGGTLRERLRRGALPPEDAVALMRKLATALGRAHERGIVHRDMKPENVIFTAAGEPLVLDLGLAKHFRRDVPGATASRSLSATGTIAGTSGYMAPEQIEDSKSAGPPCDVFALGAILHECLAGERPFPGGLLEYVVSLQAGPRLLPKKTPAWLAPIVARMLALDPRARLRDGHAVARALAAPPAGSRRKTLLATLALLAAGAGLALAFAPREHPATPRPATAKPPPAPEPPRRREALEHLALARDALRRHSAPEALEHATRALELDSTLAAAEAIRETVLAMERPNAREGLAHAERAIELDPGLAWAWQIRGVVRGSVDPGAEIADATKAIELAPDIALAWASRAEARGHMGDVDGGIADTTRAIELEPDYPVAWALRAELRLRQDDMDGAIADATRAIELGPTLELGWRTRGFARGVKHLDGAVADLTQALERSERPETHLYRGRALAELGDRDGARSDYERFLELAPPGDKQHADEARAWIAANPR